MSKLQLLLDEHKRMQAIYNERYRGIVGTRVRIITDWNGQVYGRSKPSLRGVEATVVGLMMDPVDDTPSVLLKGYGLYIGIDEIEEVDCAALSGMEIAQREADEAAGDNDPRDVVRGRV